jgi:hypothetical protein
MLAELLRPGLPPGRQAPDFELPTTTGTRMWLSDQRGHPVLLHFVSYTCPVTRGGVHTPCERYTSTTATGSNSSKPKGPRNEEGHPLGCLPEITAEMLERETGFEPATFCLGSPDLVSVVARA